MQSRVSTFSIHDTETEIMSDSVVEESEIQSSQSDSQSSMSSFTGGNEDGRYRSDISSNSSSGPLGYRNLSDIYNTTEEIEAAEEELMLVEIDEPSTYDQAAREKVWKEAMQCEIESVE